MLKSLQGKVLVLGDLNLPGIDWERHYSASAGEKVVLDVIQNQFWVQHVDFPTYDDGNLLDVALGPPGLVAGVSDEGRLGTSDHNMFKVDIVGPALERDSVEMVPDWAKADMDGLRQAIAEIDWAERLEGKTGLESWELMKKVIQEETDICAPSRKEENPAGHSG